MDHSFTKLVQDWLAAEPAQRDYSVGALYLLRLSGNQIMYRNIVAAGSDRRGNFIEYQLRQYISFRLADLITNHSVPFNDLFRQRIAAD